MTEGHGAEPARKAPEDAPGGSAPEARRAGVAHRAQGVRRAERDPPALSVLKDHPAHADYQAPEAPLAPSALLDGQGLCRPDYFPKGDRCPRY